MTAVLALAGMSATFMGTLVVPIQASLPLLLHTTKDNSAWVITVTLLAATVLTPIAGRLGDLFGKRRMVVVLLATLAVGSVICAVSDTLAPMLVGRGLQGSATAVIPLGISILRDVLPPARLAVGIATVSATLGVGGALGLPVSALIIDAVEWHAIFWFAAGLAVVDLILVMLVVPKSVQTADGSFDVLGAIGLAIGLSALMIAISKGNAWGWLSASVLSFAAGGVVVLAVWVLYELRQRSPLVDLRAAMTPVILRTNLSSIAMGFALFSASVAFPQLLQLPVASGAGMGIGLVAASLVLAPGGIAMMAMSPVSARLITAIGPRAVLQGGAILLAVSYVLPVFLMTEPWQLLLAGVAGGLGVGLGYAAMPTLIMRAVPSAETGAANGLNSLARSLGMALSAAVTGSLLATLTTQVGSLSIPTPDGFRLAFIIAAGAAVVSALIAFTIPRHPAGQVSETG